MGVMEEKIRHYQEIRRNAIVWGSIYTSLALLLTVIAAISSDTKTSEAGLILTLTVAGTALVVLTFLSIKLKKFKAIEQTKETLPA